MPPICLALADEDTREEIVGLLEAEGIPFDRARHGRGALRLLADRRYALLISDMQLPDINVFELFVRARSMRPFLRGLLVTRRASYEDLLDALRAGFDGYQIAPLQRKPFLDAIWNAQERYLLWFDTVKDLETGAHRIIEDPSKPSE